VKVSGPLHDATSWSPVDTIVSEKTKAARPRGGPSFVFAVTVIGGAALLTAGGVTAFNVKPTQGAPEQKPVASEEKPVTVASLDPTNLIVPVRKVATKSISAKVDAPQPAEPKAAQLVADAADTDALEQQDPRWARTDAEKGKTAFASVLQQTAGQGQSGIAATAALPLAEPSPAEAKDPADESKTAAVDPEDVTPKDVAKKKGSEPASSAATTDDNGDRVPGVTSSGKGRMVQINKGVNLRSRPKGGSSVLGTVPRGANVQLLGCNAWCEIVYNGRRGYVFKDFIGGGRNRTAQLAKPAKAKTVYTVDAAKPPQPQPAPAAPSATDKETPRSRIMSSRVQQ
jgi:SH3 domain-containing protein